MYKKNKTTCLNCGEQFISNRSDQKYCDAQCKTQYNNEKIKQRYHEERNVPAIIPQVNRIIKKNYTILKQYIGKNVLLSDLEKEGFRYGFITSFIPVEKANDKVYFVCYDICYHFVSETNLIISNYTYHE